MAYKFSFGTEGADLSRPAEAPDSREIIREWWAASSQEHFGNREPVDCV
jgi:hypothetical protein